MNEVLIQALIPVASTIILGLLGLAFRAGQIWLKQRGIELSVAQQDQLEQLARRGVAYAEEQARKRLKSEKVSGAEKMDLATAFVQAHLPKAKAEQVAAVAESVIHETRNHSD